MRLRWTSPSLRGAFTLIELLAAIAVVALLALLLLGGGKKWLQTAQASQCLGKLRQIGVASHLYVAEHDNTLPFTQGDPNWMIHLAPYLGVQGETFSGNSPASDAYLCPTDSSSSPRQLRTYRYVSSFRSPGNSAYSSSYNPSRATEVVSPSTLAMFFCVAYTGDRQPKLWQWDLALWKETSEDSYPRTAVNDFPRLHYGGQAVNILFHDGHTAKMTYPLPSETWHFDGK